MLYNLRTIALLMLLAGASLGVFAGTLVAGSRSGEVQSALDQRIEAELKTYTDMYSLDAAQTDELRHVLVRHRQKVRDLLLELSRRNKHEFSKIVERTQEKIDIIVKGS